MVKVGLVTAAAAPSPATRPFVNCVLPVPSSPCSAKTEPGLRSFANRRPIASVSATLLEMNVAMAQLRIGPSRTGIDCGLWLRRADGSERLGIEAADARKRNLGESL